MCLGGHYGYICQGESSTDYNRAIFICGQLGYDPAGEESIDTCISLTHTHIQEHCHCHVHIFFKLSDSLQENLKH